MKVVIPAAGGSKRFQARGYSLPKFMLELDGRTMLQHTISMFDPEDEFFIIISKDHALEFPNIPEQIQKYAKNCKVVCVDAHETGPVESILRAELNFLPTEPVLISYCDFYVSWDYTRFLTDSNGAAGAIPAFVGFHPASFGATSYCYLQVANKFLTALSEKKSFTANRHDEPASAGIYYFAKWSVFQKYAAELIANTELWQGLSELYVSVLFSAMLKDQLTIFVPLVERFICWGTPEDFEQYLYWSEYFHGKKQLLQPRMPGSNLIPLAGNGERFQKAGYTESKAFIEVSKTPMLKKACDSFPDSNNWVFVMQEKDFKNYPVADIFKNNSLKLLPLTEPTSGQAVTCLKAEHLVPADQPLFIASCDYETIYDSALWKKYSEANDCDGIIWTFKLKNLPVRNYSAFAYCRVDDNGFVTEVVEKKTLSGTPGQDQMLVGTFWFREASLFFSMTRRMLSENLTVNGEHCIGNAINLLLQNGKKFKTFEIKQWISFGDPFELKIYNYWESFFV